MNYFVFFPEASAENPGYIWGDIWEPLWEPIWDLAGSGTSLPSAPFAYSLVTPGTLTRQDFPAAAAPVVDPRNYAVPDVILGSGADRRPRRSRRPKLVLEGETPVDWRGFTVTLPSVTRTDN